MLYIFIAVLMFGLLIALHEFGHFAAAKLCGVKVNEFSIGMGPQILHRKGKETEYSFRLFPIGGFCSMEGEEEGQSGDPRAFPNRPWWQRVIILLAGVTMNFLTGYLIILCLFSLTPAFVAPVVEGYTAMDGLYVSKEMDTAALPEGGIAQAQGLEPGDRIVRVDGHRVYQSGDIALFLSRNSSGTAELEVERDGVRWTIPKYYFGWLQLGEDAFRPVLGITARVEEDGFFTRLKYAWFEAVGYVRMVWMGLSDLVTGAVGLRDMSGPLGIVDMVGQVGEAGAQAAQAAGSSAFVGAMTSILDFVAFISINLAVMNLLPIPALDGGQILFMGVNGVYTALTRKKMDPKYLGWVSAAGFACLMLLMLAVTVSDILKRFGM